MPEYLYHLYETVISTNVPMPGLPPAKKQMAQMRIKVEAPRAGLLPPAGGWDHQYLSSSDGSPILSYARLVRGFLLREHTVGDFWISGKGHDIICFPRPGTSPMAIRDTLLSPILTLVFNLRGFDGIHAATVQIGSGAVAFCGASGQGKSTLAAYFNSLGWPILSDDFLVLADSDGHITVSRGLPEVRLWPSSYERFAELHSRPARPDVSSAKLIVDLDVIEDATLPITLQTIYFLDRGEREAGGGGHEVRIETLSGRRAFFLLMDQSYRLDLQDHDMLRRQADIFTRIIAQGRVKLLKLDWGFELLPRAAELILADCAQDFPSLEISANY
ncbi:MAG: hypothetical protein GWP61_03885 [Chloroflexi bacterium]|jgi:hypothetical protein|nr:hypothetical protein [Chloroflexota bacterium]